MYSRCNAVKENLTPSLLFLPNTSGAIEGKGREQREGRWQGLAISCKESVERKCVTLLESGGKQRVRRGRAAHRDVAADVSLSTGRAEMLQSGLSERLKMC